MFVKLTPLLMIGQSRIDMVRDSFLEERSDANSGIAILSGMGIAVLLLAFVVAMAYAVAWIGSRKRCSSYRLFAELCRANSLSWRQRWLMRSLAASKQLSDPSVLFVRAELWELNEESSAVGRLKSEAGRRSLELLKHVLFCHAAKKCERSKSP